MKKEIKIPDIAENVEAGTIAGILVSEGDTVSKDQAVVEVETDKAATDIPSPYDGKVEKIMVSEGDEVSVDQVIMVLETEDDESAGEEEEQEKEKSAPAASEADEEKDKSGDSDEDDASEEDEKEQQDDEEAEEDEEVDEDEDEDEQQEVKKKSGKSLGEDIPASPAVRRLAREKGVDLSEVEGTGPRNRITPEDVESAKKKGTKGKKEKKKKEEETELPDFSQWGDTYKEKMNTVRRITARTMTSSWQEIPQVTQFDEADITEIEAFRQKNKETFDKQGAKLTMTSILLKLSGFALQRFPRFNASIDTSDDTLIMKKFYNIGLAVDTDKGLMVPVVKNVDRKSLLEVSAESADLARKARENEISPDEMKGGNFTISNLGGIGGTSFTPIVYAPQVAILGVSRATYKQVYIEDEFRKRLVLPLTLTYDHRVIDGADGARFLRWICDVLEDPYALLS